MQAEEGTVVARATKHPERCLGQCGGSALQHPLLSNPNVCDLVITFKGGCLQPVKNSSTKRFEILPSKHPEKYHSSLHRGHCIQASAWLANPINLWASATSRNRGTYDSRASVTSQVRRPFSRKFFKGRSN